MYRSKASPSPPGIPREFYFKPCPGRLLMLDFKGKDSAFVKDWLVKNGIFVLPVS